MNAWSVCLLGGWLAYDAVRSGFGVGSAEIGQFLAFLVAHPEAVGHCAQFVACGSIGMLFIFYTVSSFGSLTSTSFCVASKACSPS